MSHEPKRWDDSAMFKAVKFWPLAAATIGVIYTVGQTTKTISEIDKRLLSAESDNNDQEKRIAALESIAAQMPSMKQDIRDLKDGQVETQRDLKAILKAVK